MRKLTKIAVAAAMAALVAVCLAACGGSSSAGGSAASSSASAASYDPIYVVKHVTLYSNTYDMTTNTVTEHKEGGSWDYEYDEHGNRTQWTATNINPNTNESQTNKYTYSDFDEFGNAGSSVGADGTKSTTEWTIEDGHAVKGVSSAGSTFEYTYYADGKLKSQHIVRDDGQDVTVEFDENGRQAHQVTVGGDYPQTIDYEWTLDDQGRAVSKKVTTTMTDTGQVNEQEYTYELDENGNISTVYFHGEVSHEIEYQKIDNPSTWAWISSWVPQF